ncbi:MAG: hypothetical protein ACTSW7_00935 [Candidatus Thorarchaeota archaeon]|nr:hypothetical protein [Thermoplasmatales archaeon]
MATPKLKELARKELRKLADEYGLDISEEMKKKDIRKLIKKKMKDGVEPPRSKDELIIDFIKSMVAIEEAIEPYKEQKKDLKKQYKENSWLDAKEQKRALQALRLLKNGENIDALVKYYQEIQQQTGIGED